MHWYRCEDRNTSFFHNQANKRRGVNRIKSLKDSSGRWCDTDADIEHIVCNHFMRLFKSTNPSQSDIDRVFGADAPQGIL